MNEGYAIAPEISVVIPYYNREHTLLRALESVRGQVFQDFEIITVDDGSTDNSFELVEAYRQTHPHLKMKNLRQANSGPSSARNNGVRQAGGAFIAFLDSDDSWAPDKLAIQHAFMKSHRDILMTGTNYAVALETGPWKVGYAQRQAFARADYNRMLFKVFFCMPTVMVARSIFFEKNIWFKEGKNQAEDLLFFLQVVRNHPAGRLNNKLTYIHKEMYGQSGLTADLTGMLKNDLDNIQILIREKDSEGRGLNLGLAGVVAGYTLLKHVKRVIRSELQ